MVEHGGEKAGLTCRGAQIRRPEPGRGQERLDPFGFCGQEAQGSERQCFGFFGCKSERHGCGICVSGLRFVNGFRATAIIQRRHHFGKAAGSR